jgi:hypothetical protein
LVGGVPSCVVAEFYPDEDPFEPKALERHLAGMDDEVEICKHFVRTDALYIIPLKHGCYFGGGNCVHPDGQGFGACVGCSRFVKC